VRSHVPDSTHPTYPPPPLSELRRRAAWRAKATPRRRSWSQHPAQPAQVEGPSQTEINACNQAELHATTLKYIAMKKDSQPPNTRDAYGPRQKEWRKWCLRKRFADGELAT
jgi:hypothetical protein